MSITPGAVVTIELTSEPRRDSARKTLIRVFRKDPVVARNQRRLGRQRPSWEEWRRGGNMWHHQMRSEPGVSLRVGARYNVLASIDVVRDLASVADCVKVTPAR